MPISMPRGARRLLGGREGQSASEFLVATPILVLFILGIIYLGRLGTTYARVELASAQWGMYMGRTAQAGDNPASVALTKTLFFSHPGGGPMGSTVYNYSTASNTLERGVRDTFDAGASEVDMFYDFANSNGVWERTGDTDGPDSLATRGAGTWGACDLQALVLSPLGMDQDLFYGFSFQETWKEGVRVQSSLDGGRTGYDPAGGDYLDPSFQYWAAHFNPGDGYGPGFYGTFTLSPEEFQPLFHDDGSQDGGRGMAYGTDFNDVEFYNDAQPNAFMSPLGGDSTELTFSGRWNAAVDNWAYMSAGNQTAAGCVGSQCDALVNDLDPFGGAGGGTGAAVSANASTWEPLINPLLAFDPLCP